MRAGTAESLRKKASGYIRHALMEELARTTEPARQGWLGAGLMFLAQFRSKDEAHASVAREHLLRELKANIRQGVSIDKEFVERVGDWGKGTARDLQATRPESQALLNTIEQLKRCPAKAQKELLTVFDRETDQRAKAELRERAPFLLFAMGLALALTLLRWVVRSGFTLPPKHLAVVLTDVFWLLSLVGVAGLVVQMWWVGISWADELGSPSRRKRLSKALVLASTFVTPIVVLLARTDTDLARLIRSSWDPYLLVTAVLVALLAYSFAKRWPYSRMETYVTVYIGTVVLGVIAGLRESSFTGEAMLRHLIMFSLVGLAGAYSARRAD